MYVFIAEFYKDKRGDSPIYKTHLWGIEDAETFMDEKGFIESDTSSEEFREYLLEVKEHDLPDLFDLDLNPELEDIIGHGRDFRKVIIRANEVAHEEGGIRCRFGIEECIWANFSGNRPESRVKISYMYSPAAVDLPLRRFKEKMGVLTLFEVMEKFQEDYWNFSEEDLHQMKKEFSCGLERAIDIVAKEFINDMDLDGKPQLLHMTAVSAAGKNDEEVLVGMLHDIVEDTQWTFEDLIGEGFPEHIVDTLRLLTHDKETPYMDYIKGICESGNETALAVKINDLNHNLQRGRAGGHWEHVTKHEKALAYIEDYIKNTKEHEE